jgi:hypothetical protein
VLIPLAVGTALVILGMAFKVMWPAQVGGLLIGAAIGAAAGDLLSTYAGLSS